VGLGVTGGEIEKRKRVSVRERWIEGQATPSICNNFLGALLATENNLFLVVLFWPPKVN
jgi:hypothetical protein